MSKSAFQEKLVILARAKGITQTQIASELDMQLSHINRYFNGKSDIGSSHLIEILKQLDINLEKIVSEKINQLAKISDEEISTKEDCMSFLFNRLDDLGKQTFLNNLAWATKVSTKAAIPEKIEALLKKEISLI